MKSLLRIDASVREEGSHSRGLADYFERRWREVHPGGRVARRDLAVEAPPHLTGAMMNAGGAGDDGGARLGDKLIGELAAADEVVISAPIYNFGPPSTLKAYFDQVVRRGRAFDLRDGRYVGLLAEKTATILMTCGGAADGENDFLSAWLRRTLRFIGIVDVELVTLEGTVWETPTLPQRVEAARKEIDRRLGIGDDEIWQGEFSDEDRRQINRLRAAQARAIVDGDAEAYAELCADDVQLMIPGHAPALGRAALIKLERRLLPSARFIEFRKRPLRVVRSGELAVETGLQWVRALQEGGGPMAVKQKYVHVYRRMAGGWRFVILTSNECME